MKMRLLLAVCLLVAITAPGADWKAGLSRTIITPQEFIWMSGYASRDKPAQSKLTELWAKCLVLEEASGKRSVLVTMDLIGIGREDSLWIRNAITKRHKMPIESVVLSTSHTHTGPVVGANLGAMFFYGNEEAARVQAYTDQLRKMVVSLVDGAMKDLRPAHLEWGQGRTTFGVNRRNNPERDVPELRKERRLNGPVDHDVPVLAIRDADRKLRAVICGYACHATVLSSFQWSGDWPGFAQLEMEERHPGVQAMVWAGCGGDINPLPRREVTLARQYGGMLADAVDEVLSTGLRPAGPALIANYREISLEFSSMPTRDDLEQRTRSDNKYEAGRARWLLKRWDAEGGLNKDYPYPVQTWRFEAGPLWVILGGEVVVDYALRLKSTYGRHNTWVMGYANDVMAYIPSERVLAEGGYEGAGAMVYYGQPSPWAAGVEERIIREVARQVGDARSVAASAPLYADHSELRVYLDDQRRLQRVRAASDWPKRRERILQGMQEAMGALPDMTRLGPLDVKVSKREELDDHIRLTLSYLGEPGDRVPAYLLLPKEVERKAAAMLCLHQTVNIGKGEPVGLGGKPNLRYARDLVRQGYVCLAPDYPSFGDYDYDFGADKHPSGTMKGIINHMRGVDLLVSRPEVDPDRIGVIGHSLGGHNAMFVGAFDTRLKVVVSSCGWTPFHDYYEGNIQGWTSDRYMPRLRDVYGLNPDRVPFDFYEVVAALAPRAFFSCSPRRDHNFAVAGVRKAEARAGDIYALLGAREKLVVRYPDAGHDFPEEVRGEAYRFVGKVLGN